MRKMAIYARQSLDKEDSLSIQKQIDDCKNSINNYKQRTGSDAPIQTFIDRGFSGKNTDRPSFIEMMEEVKADRIETIFFYRLDRISRNLLDFNLMWKELQAHDCSFVSCTETMLDTTTPTGEAQVQMTMLFAELERKTIAQRVKDNYYFRIANDGRWASGPAPFGFRNAKTVDGKSTLEFVEEEIEAVKYCFDKYAHCPNISLFKLCQDLKAMGYKSKSRSGAWTATTLSRMLQSPVYVIADERLQKFFEMRKIKFLNDCTWTGETSCHIVAKKSGNSHISKYDTLENQSIYLTNFKGHVDSKTYIMVQERLRENEQIARSNAPSVLQELAGLIKCKECGYAVKAYSKNKKTGHVSLCCAGRTIEKVCNVSFAGIKFADIQSTVGNEIQKKLDAIAKEVLEDMFNTKEKEDKITALNEQIENLIDLAALGGQAAKKVHSKIEKIEAEIKQLQLDEFMNTKKTERLRISDSLPIVYARMTQDEKKSICQQMIQKILLSHGGDIEIIWKV